MKKPYVESVLSEHIIVRGFSSNVKRSELVWHRDMQDRVITVLEGNGWYFQKDNQLPFLLKEGDKITIKAKEYHRLIKGKSDLIVKINFSSFSF